MGSERSWKISRGGPGKVLDFFSSERVGTLAVMDSLLSPFDLTPFELVAVLTGYLDGL